MAFYFNIGKLKKEGDKKKTKYIYFAANKREIFIFGRKVKGEQKLNKRRKRKKGQL